MTSRITPTELKPELLKVIESYRIIELKQLLSVVGSPRLSGLLRSDLMQLARQLIVSQPDPVPEYLVDAILQLYRKRYPNCRIPDLSHCQVNYQAGTSDAAVAEENASLASDTVAQAKLSFPECPICLDELDGQQSCVITLTCRHDFHFRCINEWSENKGTTCPTCRAPFEKDALLMFAAF